MTQFGTGIYLSLNTLNELTPTLRDQLLQEVFRFSPDDSFAEQVGADLTTVETALSEGENDEDENFVELSPRQAKEFIKWCSPKVRTALEAMVKGPSPTFQVADVAKAVGVPAPDLRGVWAGITRRSRTISGDGSAYMIDWSIGEPQYDSADMYIDQRAAVSDLTYSSLRKAFGMH